MKTSTLSILGLAIGMIAMSFLAAPAVEDHKDGESMIHWVGKKVTGQHEGTVQFADLNFDLNDDGTIKDCSFTVDMTTMVCTDLDNETGAKLIGHLISNDFFGVEDYPTATFQSTMVAVAGKGTYKMQGDLTIKGQTHPVMFGVEVTEEKDMKVASATVIVDRTKYGIQYGSGSFFEGLGDKMIEDNFTLMVTAVID